MKFEDQQFEVPFDGGRARVTFSPRDDYRQTYRRRSRKSRVLVWTDEKFDLMSDFVNRTRRPHAQWRKAIKPVLEGMGIDTKGMRWSQYAYCTCPCSPGFILSKRYEKNFVSTNPDKKYPMYLGYDIDILLIGNISSVDESIPVDPARVDAIGRVAAGVL